MVEHSPELKAFFIPKQGDTARTGEPAVFDPGQIHDTDGTEHSRFWCNCFRVFVPFAAESFARFYFRNIDIPHTLLEILESLCEFPHWITFRKPFETPGFKPHDLLTLKHDVIVTEFIHLQALLLTSIGFSPLDDPELKEMRNGGHIAEFLQKHYCNYWNYDRFYILKLAAGFPAGEIPATVNVTTTNKVEGLQAMLMWVLPSKVEKVTTAEGQPEYLCYELRDPSPIPVTPQGESGPDGADGGAS
jgi:hypothetical protein